VSEFRIPPLREKIRNLIVGCVRAKEEKTPLIYNKGRQNPDFFSGKIENCPLHHSYKKIIFRKAFLTA